MGKEPSLACGDVEAVNYASPSPRGWTMASDALHKAKQFNISDLETITAIVSGFVGLEAGSKFKLWYQYFKKFEPKILSLIEDNQFPNDYDKLDVSEAFIFCITLCYLTKNKIQNSKNKNRNLIYIETVCNFFDKFQVEEEVQLVMLRNSFPIEFLTKHKLYESKIFLEKNKSLQADISLK